IEIMKCNTAGNKSDIFAGDFRYCGDMKKKPTFADLLLSFPGSPEDLPERNRTPGRDFNWIDKNDDPDFKIDDFSMGSNHRIHHTAAYQEQGPSRLASSTVRNRRTK